MPKVKLLELTDDKRRLDRYELIGEIASGGMATVYLARLAGVGGFQRFYAVKCLHPHLAGEQEFIEMFLDEARLAAGIHNPHVVPILEVGQGQRGYYLVMEYIEGDTLGRVVARSIATSGAAPPTPILARVLLDALAGLHAAHELCDPLGSPLHLVHRDCSPQNILVGLDGTSRLTDFGVARASARLGVTRAERLKGKLAYMSPEQVQGEGEVDRRSDLFAMGIVMWEVFSGKRLFKASTETATMARILQHPIPRLEDVAEGVHPAVSAVVARALERDVNARFQTASEMADALEDAAVQAGGVAAPREVAAYLQSAMGQEIAAQRESLRSWLSLNEPSGSISKSAVRPVAAVSVTLMSAPATDSARVGADEHANEHADEHANEHVNEHVNERGSKKWLPLALVAAALAGGAFAAFWIMRTGAEPAPVGEQAATAPAASAAAEPPAPSAEKPKEAEPTSSAAPPATAQPVSAPLGHTAATKPAATPHGAPTHGTARPKPTSPKPPAGDDLSNPYR